MGPISTQWYAKRGLTHKVKRKITSQLVAELRQANVGDEYETDEVTTYYAGGRIDIRDDSKEGYEGWLEYALPIMAGESWNLLSDWLDDFTSESLVPYNELIDTFEKDTNTKIRWAPK